VEHHIEEEERNIWADVRENFDSDARIAMNRRFEAAKTKVKIPEAPFFLPNWWRSASLARSGMRLRFAGNALPARFM
jgi:hypothetical protein